MARKHVVALAVASVAMTMTGAGAFAQLVLPEGPTYVQNFDSLSGGLPVGWSVATGATVSANGTSILATPAVRTWTDTGGAFKNVAGISTGETATSTQQSAATDRALAVRQTGAFGDPGAAFILTLANTTGVDLHSLSLDLSMFTNSTQSPRSTQWTIDYRVGESGDFTALGTYDDPGVFGATPFTANLDTISALDESTLPVFFRVVALSGSANFGSRDTFGIDNFTLNYTGGGTGTGGGDPRNLTWDANGSTLPNPSNGNGTWDTAAANWHSASSGNVSWANTRPDNATFGTGSGTGTATVTLGADMTAGTVTFAAGSPAYTIDSNSYNLAVNGVAGAGITANQSATISGNVAIPLAQTWTVAPGATLSVGTMSGAQLVTKDGAGELKLAGTGGASTGGVTASAGTVTITGVNASGVPGSGSGTITMNAGTTLNLQGATLGFEPDLTPGTNVNLVLNPGATLVATGTSGISGSNQYGTGAGTITIRVPNVGDGYITGNSARNAGSGGQTSAAVIRVEGAGVMHIASGGVSTSASGTQFSGSWVVAMDQTTGVLAVGPILSGGFGEVLNGLGYQAPTGLTGAYAGLTRPVTVTSGTLAFGADQANGSSNSVTIASSFRSPVTLDGGKIASTGFKYESFSQQDGSTLSATEKVVAKLAADITTVAGKTSTVLLYDPVTGAGQGPRSLNITTDPNVLPSVVPGTLAWGAGSTLAVDAGGTTGGVLKFDRTAAAENVVTVGAGATLSIGAGATVELAGEQDAMNDAASGNAVAVANAGTFKVTAGVKTVGAITGTGSTDVAGGATLAIKAGSATSTVGGLSVDSTSFLDVKNNRLVVTSASAKAGVLADVASGYAGGAWNGAGINTSMADAAHGLGTFDSGTTLTVAYAAYGDLDLDGKVNADDYVRIDRGVAKNLGGWQNGDLNYSGTIDQSDYFLIDTNFLSGGIAHEAMASLLAQREAQFGQAYVASLMAAVPEPTSLGLAGAVAAGLLGRRRRSAR